MLQVCEVIRGAILGTNSGVAVAVAVAVGLDKGVRDGVGDGVTVGVSVGAVVGVIVGVAVRKGVGVAVATAVVNGYKSWRTGSGLAKTEPLRYVRSPVFRLTSPSRSVTWQRPRKQSTSNKNGSPA